MLYAKNGLLIYELIVNRLKNFLNFLNTIKFFVFTGRIIT